MRSITLTRLTLVLGVVLAAGCSGSDGPNGAADPGAQNPPAPAESGDPPATTSATTSTPGPSPLAGMDRRSWRRVVVDAGHGGEDEGAHGVSGILEKDVTLATAMATARALRRAGFDVIETRTEDTTLSLDRRTEVANASGAGIFLSIHANSAPASSARGVEIYSMDLASDEAAGRLAARENLAHALLGDAAERKRDAAEALLDDLRMGARSDRSRDLATTLQREVVTELRGVYGRRSIKDRGARTAPFWVLVDTQVPAVLIELGYLTNESDEARVRTRGHQDLVAAAIARGVEDFAARAARAERPGARVARERGGEP